MPKPDDRSEEALNRLGKKLQSFEATRSRSVSTETNGSIGEGYRLLAGLLGGVLGGVGFGWLFDRFAHTAPWGIVVGLSLGAGVSVYSAARSAVRMGNQITEANPPKAVPFDDDDD